MIRAWVLYEDSMNNLHFEERDGESFQATDPDDWGLADGNVIILVLQQGQFLQAWIEGEPLKDH